MIDIQKAIYDLLKNSSAIVSIVGDDIHTWADGKDIRDDYSEKFPQVTYQMIGTPNMINSIGVRTERYQISAWDMSQKGAITLSNTIVQTMNRLGPTAEYKSCNLINVSPATYDPETKSFGVHTDFAIVIYDPSY